MNVEQKVEPAWRREGAIFLAALVTFAYFHQGGGWSENVRFAQTRALVEEGRFAIDSYLIYTLASSASPERLARHPIKDGTCEIGNQLFTLAWNGGTPVDSRNSSIAGRSQLQVEDAAASGDLSYSQGRFHPAKAPGTAVLAVPGYAFLFCLERLVGLEPDDWWTLTINAWLTSVLSVGIVSALGCVLFFRLADSFGEGARREALLATGTFAAGTLFLPYGTTFSDHNIVAVGLLAGFYWIYQVKHSRLSAPQSLAGGNTPLFLAGLSAGYTATCNYVAAGVVLFLGIYLASTVRQARSLAVYCLGVLIPFLALCAHNMVCFGIPFTTNYHFENPLFRAGDKALFGVFDMPRIDVLVMLLVSPFRGLFFSSPVLLMGVIGWILLLRMRQHRAEAWLFAAIVAFFLLFNSSFNGWAGGWALGPRYLIPAIPFLALPLVLAFKRFFRTTAALAALSVGLMLVATAVDPHCPLGPTQVGTVAGRSLAWYSPLTEYELPLFISGRAEPVLRAQWRGYQAEIVAGRFPPHIQARNSADAQAELDHAFAEDDVQLFPLAAFRGPVSVNSGGAYEGSLSHVFPPSSMQSRWNSFNVGEFLFPESRLSLLPLLFVNGLLTFVAWRNSLLPALQSGRSGTPEKLTPVNIAPGRLASRGIEKNSESGAHSSD